MLKTKLFLDGFVKRALERGIDSTEVENLYHTYRFKEASDKNPEQFRKGAMKAIEKLQKRWKQ